MKRNIPRLIAEYGSASELARVAGIHRTAVTRWESNKWTIGEAIQIRILKDSLTRLNPRGQPLIPHEVAMWLGVKRCDCCKKPINGTIREILGEDCEDEIAEAAE
jgi:transcriptional regulator with XRE-family HTH domain